MLLRFKKVADGVVLACIRADGTAAVQRTGHGGFFALHDLMHYAAETVLVYDRAFLGLMAAGWDFSTFGDHDDARSRALPDQAGWAERIVSALSRADRLGVAQDPDLLPLLTEEINLETAGPGPGACPPLTPSQVASIYSRFRALADQWGAVPLGGHLELPFPAPGPE
jgi:hypothetical protein